MKDAYKIIQNSEEIPQIYKYYWGYQFHLGERILVDKLKKLNAFKPGVSVAEIGSAEGGVLAAFVLEGANNALGTDIVQSRLDLGEKISKLIDIPIEFKNHNLLNEPLKPEWQNAFDLVILRDVIEHLDDTELAQIGRAHV